MKKFYDTPELEITLFSSVDIITISGATSQDAIDDGDFDSLFD